MTVNELPSANRSGADTDRVLWLDGITLAKRDMVEFLSN